MIILGVNDRAKTVGEGTFFCPHCQHSHSYARKKAKLYFSLFFVPLIPLKDLGEYVECRHCWNRFSPEVVQRPAMRGAAAHQAPAVRADLESGTPLEMARQKLINEGYAAEFADEVVAAAAGTWTRQCPSCRLTYIHQISRCAACGEPLAPTP